jgi:type II secretory pathway component PulM
MKAWLESLEARERIFVLGGAVAAVVALFYAFVWTPLDRGQQSMQESVVSWQRALTEIRPLKGMQAPATATARPQAGQQTPVVIVDRTLRARGLDRALRRSQPTTSDGIRVEFENVAFDDLVLWLDDLGNQYSMQVASGSFSPGSEGARGRVNATLTLERSL